MDLPRLRLAPALLGVDDVAQAGRAPIRVVLADDHALMRSSLRLLLDGERDIDVFAEADDAESAVRHLHSRHAHVLILDLNMPGGSSLAAIGPLRERAPDTQIVVMTMEDDAALAQRALAAGALGFVVKDRADAELAQAVRAAAHGDAYVSPSLAARLEARAQSRLTGREPPGS